MVRTPSEIDELFDRLDAYRQDLDKLDTANNLQVLITESNDSQTTIKSIEPGEIAGHLIRILQDRVQTLVKLLKEEHNIEVKP